ncbi:MAG: NUDIX domain-containing protein [Bacteroidaceae bacterium]|nr:NUDIX domain-containing protein [Bacteroidaceae bacterium]
MKHVSAGLVVLCKNMILLVKQSGDHDGCHLSIPKGLINLHESPFDAAIRETYEETGIRIPSHLIEPPPYLMNVNLPGFQRRIIYFVARIEKMPDISPIDTKEIAWAGFLEYEEAERFLQLSQLSVLLHIYPSRLPARAINWLCYNNYVTKEKHHDKDIYIYNYTSRCKKAQLWDEITLWCRGLITDNRNNIKYRPLKKFFEEYQMFEHFFPEAECKFRIYEKKDGALGILYWIEDAPFIATRGSFNTLQALNGTRILYTKHADVIGKMNKSYTYFFEIIYPKDKHVVDYGSTEDLFLIGAYDNIKQKNILPEEILGLSFPKVSSYSDLNDWNALYSIDKKNEEGYVAYFEDGTRIKIKFASYKKKYELLYV